MFLLYQVSFDYFNFTNNVTYTANIYRIKQNIITHSTCKSILILYLWIRTFYTVAQILYQGKDNANTKAIP